MSIRDWGSYTPPVMTSESMRNWGSYAPPVINAGQIGNNDLGVDLMGGAPNLGLGTPGIGAGPGNWWDSLFDRTDTNTGIKSQGMAMPLISGASALMSGFLGLKQYGLQKDALKQSKKEFEMNWGAQQKATNSAMEDRQRARVASNPNAYQSVGDYMKKNGI